MMTANIINALANQALARHNRALELLQARELEETKRANLAREMENIRSNRAREMENIRSNRASEYLRQQEVDVSKRNADTNRQNADVNRTNALTNQRNSSINSRNADTNRISALTSQYSAVASNTLKAYEYAESVRHNQTVETETHRNNTVINAIEESRANSYARDIQNRYNIEGARLKLDTNKFDWQQKIDTANTIINGVRAVGAIVAQKQ